MVIGLPMTHSNGSYVVKVVVFKPLAPQRLNAVGLNPVRYFGYFHVRKLSG
jgi:hypothetical protein